MHLYDLTSTVHTLRAATRVVAVMCVLRQPHTDAPKRRPGRSSPAARHSSMYRIIYYCSLLYSTSPAHARPHLTEGEVTDHKHLHSARITNTATGDRGDKAWERRQCFREPKRPPGPPLFACGGLRRLRRRLRRAAQHAAPSNAGSKQGWARARHATRRGECARAC